MTICSAHLALFFIFYKLPCRSQNLPLQRYASSFCVQPRITTICLPSRRCCPRPVCLWANFPPEGLPMGSIPCFYAFDTLIISGDYLSGEARSTQLWSKESRFSGILSQVRILFYDSASRSSYFMGFYL